MMKQKTSNINWIWFHLKSVFLLFFFVNCYENTSTTMPWFVFPIEYNSAESNDTRVDNDEKIKTAELLLTENEFRARPFARAGWPFHYEQNRTHSFAEPSLCFRNWRPFAPSHIQTVLRANGGTRMGWLYTYKSLFNLNSTTVCQRQTPLPAGGFIYPFWSLLGRDCARRAMLHFGSSEGLTLSFLLKGEKKN